MRHETPSPIPNRSRATTRFFAAAGQKAPDNSRRVRPPPPVAAAPRWAIAYLKKPSRRRARSWACRRAAGMRRRPRQHLNARLPLQNLAREGRECLAIVHVRTAEECRGRAYRRQPCNHDPLQRLDPFAGVDLELGLRNFCSASPKSQLNHPERTMPVSAKKPSANRRQWERRSASL